MRVLFLAVNVPVPPNNGVAIRSLSFLKGLVSRGHDVDFISFSNADPSATADLLPLTKYCKKIELIHRRMPTLSENSDYWSRVRDLFTFQSYSFRRFHSESMRKAICQALHNCPYDVIFADSLYPMVNIPEMAVPILLNCHNVEHIILQRYASLEGNPLKRFYARFESARLRKEERSACNRVSVALVCSDVDRQILNRLCPEVRIVTVPNVVDTEWVRPEEREQTDQVPVLLYQGGMDWYPNRDAVKFFARSILPIVQTRFPNIRFVVAGRNPPAQFVRELQTIAGIEFTGTVPDMRPYLKAATVVVVPLRVGGGTRIKILESAATGKAVVSTEIGAEGLEFRQNKEILLANQPGEFAQSVINLLEDPIRRTEMGQAARQMVIERYSQTVLERIMDEVLESVLESKQLSLGSRL